MILIVVFLLIRLLRLLRPLVRILIFENIL